MQLNNINFKTIENLLRPIWKTKHVRVERLWVLVWCSPFTILAGRPVATQPSRSRTISYIYARKQINWNTTVTIFYCIWISFPTCKVSPVDQSLTFRLNLHFIWKSEKFDDPLGFGLSMEWREVSERELYLREDQMLAEFMTSIRTHIHWSSWCCSWRVINILNFKSISLGSE